MLNKIIMLVKTVLVYFLAAYISGTAAELKPVWDLDAEKTAIPEGSKFGLKLDYNLAAST